VGPFAVAGSRNTLSPSSVRGTKEEVKHLSPVNLPFRVLVFLLIAIGETVVASRLVTPKKGLPAAALRSAPGTTTMNEASKSSIICGMALVTQVL